MRSALGARPSVPSSSWEALVCLGVLVHKVSERITEIGERRRMGHSGTGFKKHVVIIGWDEFARSVAHQLLNADLRIAIVADAKGDVDLIHEQFSKDRVHALFADLQDPLVLQKAGIREAGMVFPNLATVTDKSVAILDVKREFPGTRLVVALDNDDLRGPFRTAEVTFVLSRGELAAKLLPVTSSTRTLRSTRRAFSLRQEQATSTTFSSSS